MFSLILLLIPLSFYDFCHVLTAVNSRTLSLAHRQKSGIIFIISFSTARFGPVSFAAQETEIMLSALLFPRLSPPQDRPPPPPGSCRYHTYQGLSHKPFRLSAQTPPDRCRRMSRILCEESQSTTGFFINSPPLIYYPEIMYFVAFKIIISSLRTVSYK